LGGIKKLAGQTAIYGLGTIVPRLLNYLLLTPFYTYIFVQGNYGIVTELYAYVAFLLVILTYGMETTYFRFAQGEENNHKVFSTSLIMVTFTTTIFTLLVLAFIHPIAKIIQYENNANYVIWMALIVGLDAISSIPFAKLRQQNRPLTFVSIKIINVVINILLNLFFFVYCPKALADNPNSWVNAVYSAEIGVGYAFLSNLIASVFSFLFLLPFIFSEKLYYSASLAKQMIKYSAPLLIVGIAGIANEHIDKILLKYLIRVPDVLPAGYENAKDYVMSQVGLYGANYKLAVLMTIFIQMFRFAAEPFFFAQQKEKNSDQTYADVLKYFTIFGLLIFLGVMLYIDIFKYFIGPEYRVGIYIVPIILMANLMLGIYFNLSVWYKLKNLTKYGAYTAIVGAIITIVINVVWIPEYNYIASAWATLICYATMVVISYVWGQKYMKIPYDVKRLLFYIALSLLIYFVSTFISIENTIISFAVNTILFLTFIGTVFLIEKKKIKI
jgi:O-antigen/teichoic acid export membrane protein